jgi:hypothetical protein
MRPLVTEVSTTVSPEALIERAGLHPLLLRSSHFDSPQARYSFLVANPFLIFRSFGSRCLTDDGRQKKNILATHGICSMP